MRNVPHQMILQLTFTLFFIPPSLPPNSVKTSAETLTNHPFVSVKVAPIRRGTTSKNLVIYGRIIPSPFLDPRLWHHQTLEIQRRSS